MTPEQITALSAPLDARRVKTRAQSGRTLSYIEGWWAISEANRIFGFDGWTRETIDLRCVAEKPRKIRDADGWGVTYIAKVRIVVGGVVREGCGTGHGIDRDLGQAHESALKEAETDAMKRAFMTWGNAFGLTLYDKDRAGVETPPANAPNPAAAKSTPSDPDGQGAEWVRRQKLVIDECNSQERLEAWLDKYAGFNGAAGGWANPASGSSLYRLKANMAVAYEDLHAYYLKKLTEV